MDIFILFYLKQPILNPFADGNTLSLIANGMQNLFSSLFFLCVNLRKYSLYSCIHSAFQQILQLRPVIDCSCISMKTRIYTVPTRKFFFCILKVCYFQRLFISGRLYFKYCGSRTVDIRCNAGSEVHVYIYT